MRQDQGLVQVEHHRQANAVFPHLSFQERRELRGCFEVRALPLSVELRLHLQLVAAAVRAPEGFGRRELFRRDLQLFCHLDGDVADVFWPELLIVDPLLCTRADLRVELGVPRLARRAGFRRSCAETLHFVLDMPKGPWPDVMLLTPRCQLLLRVLPLLIPFQTLRHLE